MISILIILNLILIILNLTLLICNCCASRGNGSGVKGKVPKNRPVPRP